MGKYSLVLSNEAKEHLRIWHRSGDKAAIKRIEQIFVELAEHPQKGIGKPERLKHQLSGLWSREIDKKNRIVYDIRDTEIAVYIVSAKGHYTDK
jgi:toxin YoeB